MSKQGQITDFVNLVFIGFQRVEGLSYFGPSFYDGGSGQRLSVETLAKELLALSEFRALELGAWLGTPDGEIFTQAVEAAMPPFYGEDVALIAEALRMAAKLQHEEMLQKTLLGASLVFVLVGIAALVRKRSTLSSWF
jgi:hypothetical protein